MDRCRCSAATSPKPRYAGANTRFNLVGDAWRDRKSADSRDETSCDCRECIGDSVLANELATQCSHSRCSYCREQRRAVPLGVVAERIHEVLQEHFELIQIDSSGFFPGSGFPVTNVISDIAGLSDEIASDVTELLPDSHGYTSRADGGDDPYGPDAEYEEASPNDWYFRETWSGFVAITTHWRQCE